MFLKICVLVQFLVTVVVAASTTSTTVEPTTTIPGPGKRCTDECTPANLTECVNDVCICRKPFEFTGKYCVTLPDAVVDFNITDVTSDTIELSWKPPTNEGTIEMYFITVLIDGLCPFGRVYECLESPPSSTSGVPGCSGNLITRGSCQGDLSVIIQSLLPYTDYTLMISANNDFYVGKNTSLNTQTHIAASLPARNVQAIPGGFPQNFLTIKWDPPIHENGPTTYNLTIFTAAGRRNSTFIHGNTFTLRDFGDTSLLLADLLFSWRYRFAVYAFTDAGGTMSNISNTAETGPAEPGQVEDLTVEAVQDGLFAVKLTWACPLEKQRNGQITSYTVTYSNDQKMTKTQTYGSYAPEDPCLRMNSLLIPVLPNLEYTFTVHANAEFKGHEKMISYFTSYNGTVNIAPVIKQILHHEEGSTWIILSAVGGGVIVVLAAILILVVHRGKRKNYYKV